MSSSTRPRPIRWLILIVAGIGVCALIMRDSFSEWMLGRQPLESLSTRYQSGESGHQFLIHYAQRLVKGSQLSEARGVLEQALKAVPADASDRESGRILALAGYVAARTGDSASADNYLSRAAKIVPEDRYALVGQAIASFSKQQFADAERILTPLSKRLPEDAEVWSRLGVTYINMGKPADAIHPLEMAARLSPNDPALRADLGEAFAQQSRFAEAAAAHREAVRLDPNEPGYRAMLSLSLAHVARTRDQYREARDILDKAVVEQGRDPGLLQTRAGLAMRFRDFEQAQADYQEVLAQSPTNSDALYNLGTAQLRLGLPQAAIQYRLFQSMVDKDLEVIRWMRMVEVSPNSAKVHANLAEALRRSGSYQDALAELEVAVRLAPNDAKLKAALQTARSFMSRSRSSMAQ